MMTMTINIINKYSYCCTRWLLLESNLALIICLESLNPRVCFSKSSDLIILLTIYLSFEICPSYLVANRASGFWVVGSDNEFAMVGQAKKPHWRVLWKALPEENCSWEPRRQLTSPRCNCSWEQWEQLTSPEYISSISPAVLAVLHRVPRWDQLRLHLSIVKL